ncbi:hypothetical protein EU537_00725 [Candidatus Thorarchaeota archaeon]|nr:MAG: hypothetical protein EU537_00725 [Candidatus Thorarchaeota archaeon]
MKPYLVFMCPKCRNFTNAPLGQKRRKCSYCGKIINIENAASALFDSPQEAGTAVREFNASRGGGEFDEAVEKSRKRITELMPAERVSVDDISDKSGESLPSGKRRRLMMMLEREAKEAPCPLERIERLSKEYRLDWAWVEDQLNALGNTGELIFPRPWTIKLIKTAKKDKKDDNLISKDVSNEIMELLRENDGELNLEKILCHFKDKGISTSSVESSLDRLLHNGEIYTPRPSTICLI